MNETIIDILSEENILTNPRVSKICDTIVKRHLGRVKAVIYYGSSLRDLDKLFFSIKILNIYDINPVKLDFSEKKTLN